MKLRTALLALIAVSSISTTQAEDKMTLEAFNSMSSLFINMMGKSKSDILMALTYPTAKYRLITPVCELSVESNTLRRFAESNIEQYSAKHFIEESERDIELANILMKEHSIDCD